MVNQPRFFWVLFPITPWERCLSETHDSEQGHKDTVSTDVNTGNAEFQKTGKAWFDFLVASNTPPPPQMCVWQHMTSRDKGLVAVPASFKPWDREQTHIRWLRRAEYGRQAWMGTRWRLEGFYEWAGVTPPQRKHPLRCPSPFHPPQQICKAGIPIEHSPV